MVKVRTDSKLNSTWEMFSGVTIHHYYIIFLCKKCLQLIFSIFQLLYEVLVKHKNWKGPMQAPLWKNEFFILFFNNALFWWTDVPTKGSDLQIPTTSRASGLLRLACSFLTHVLTNLTSFLCCRSGISHQAVRGHSCATTIPQCHIRQREELSSHYQTRTCHSKM